MNRLRFAALAILTLGIAASHALAQENVLLNSGFEFDAVSGAEPVAGATDWSGFANNATTSTPTSPARSGVGAMRLTGGGGYSVPGVFQDYPATPGQIWNLQGYMLTTDPLPAGDVRGVLKIVFKNELDGDLEPAEITIGTADAQPFPGVLGTPQLNSSSTTNVWQFSQARGVAPEGTVGVRFFALFVDGVAPGGTAYFDDLEATLVEGGGQDLVGDFDGDNDVDSDDLGDWRTAFGPSGAADADGDNDSDGGDFLLWQRNVTPPLAIAAVPEPTTGLLLAAAGLAVASARRRARCAR